MDPETRARLVRQLEEMKLKDPSFKGSTFTSGYVLAWFTLGAATFFLSSLIAGWWPASTRSESLFLFLAIFLCLGFVLQSLYRIIRHKFNQRLRNLVETFLADQDTPSV